LPVSFPGAFGCPVAACRTDLNEFDLAGTPDLTTGLAGFTGSSFFTSSFDATVALTVGLTGPGLEI